MVTPDARFITHVVKVIRNATDTANIYQIDGVAQPTLVFTEGDTHYFDLSHPSLYNAVTANSHIFQLSLTSGGTHGSGVEYTTGVTKSASYIETGTTGAFLQIVVAEDTAPDPLFYYCKNHSGMGGRIETREAVSFIRDKDSNLVLDGSATTIFGIQLEDSLGNGFIREEETISRTAHMAFNFPDASIEIQLEGGEEGILLPEQDGDTTDITTSTDFGGIILLERTTLDGFAGQTSDTIGGFLVQDDGGKVLIDNVREIDVNGKLLLDATDSSGTNDGIHLATENAGRSIILDGTDASGSDANSKLLFEDETGDGDIILDGTDSDSTDAGDNIINESPIDFSNKNVTITDSSGASGTIIKADIATASSSVATTSTSIGEYSGIRSLLGEDLNRIQDSFYYQDYSYEVQVGAAFSDYVNELKKSVHPAGFRPFGKVSIASLVSVAVTDSGVGVKSFLGGDRFSPILASTFETIFDQNILTRMGSQKYEIGSADDQIRFENGFVAGDKLVLDASSTSTGSTTPTDVSIILEDSLQPSGYGYNTAYIILNSSGAGFADEGGKVDLESGSFENEFENILLEDGDTISLEDGFMKIGDSILFEGNSDVEMGSLGGRMMSESSHAPGGLAEKLAVKQIVTKLTTRPTPRITRNLLVYLAETPFGRSTNNIQLENSTIGEFETETIVLDGHAPLNEGEVPIILEGDEDLDHIILETGGNILMEDGYRVLNEDQGFVTSGLKDRLLLERGGVVMAESDRFSFPIGFVVDENENLILEDHHSDHDTISFNDFGNFRFEDILRPNKLILEQGSASRVGDVIILEDHVDGNASNSRLINESSGFIELEEFLSTKLQGSGVADQDNANAVENTGILLENFGQLLLDGTDSDSSNSNSYIVQESDQSRLTLELSGSIIEEDLSSASVVEHLILEGSSGGRLLNEIIVDPDAFDDPTEAFERFDNILLEQGDGDILVLDGTDSDSTDAGDAILLHTFDEIVSPIALETTFRISNEGQIPFENRTLNSLTSPIGGQSIVRPAEIRTRTTGDIALEDGLGHLVLNGTDGSSTNAGDNMDLEGATGITI